MKKILCILLLVLMQQTFSQDFNLDEIKLKDSVLVSELEKFIKETKVSNKEFVDKGFVEVRLLYANIVGLK